MSKQKEVALQGTLNGDNPLYSNAQYAINDTMASFILHLFKNLSIGCVCYSVLMRSKNNINEAWNYPWNNFHFNSAVFYKTSTLEGVRQMAIIEKDPRLSSKTSILQTHENEKDRYYSLWLETIFKYLLIPIKELGINKSISPVNQTGGSILYYGNIKQ